MTTANAWYQANYRKTLRGKNLSKLDTVIDGRTKDAIERMAKLYGISQREVIERVVVDVEGRVMASMSAGDVERYLTA